MTLFKDTYRIESTRLQGWDYGSPGWYFVTICARNHESLFGEIANGQMQLFPAGQVVESECKNIPAHYSNVEVDAFVVMPNHLHAIVVIRGVHQYSPHHQKLLPRSGSLSAIVRSFKAGVTYRCRTLGIVGFGWQTGFHDHILRGNASLSAVRDYIEKNPANWEKDQENYK